MNEDGISIGHALFDAVIVTGIIAAVLFAIIGCSHVQKAPTAEPIATCVNHMQADGGVQVVCTLK